MAVPPVQDSAIPEQTQTAPPPDEEPPAAGGDVCDGDASDEIATRPLLWTTVICVALAWAGHGLIWAAYALEWNKPDNVNVPWEPVAGLSLSSIAIVAFGGFYISSRRARIAIAASFLLTFFVTLTFVLTINAFAEQTAGAAKELFDDFRNIVGLIVGFYFASETAVSGLKVLRAGGTDANLADIQRADRDFAPPAAKARKSRGGG